MVALSIFLNGFTLDSDDLPLLYKSSQKLTSEFTVKYSSAGNNLPRIEKLTQNFFFFFIFRQDNLVSFLAFPTTFFGLILPNGQRT